MWTNKSPRRTHPRLGGSPEAAARPPRRVAEEVDPGGGSGASAATDGGLIEMASVEEVLAAIETLDMDRPWSAVADDVLPVLRRRRPLPADAEEPVRRSWPPGLETAFGIDIGPAFVFVGQWALEHWGITADELGHRAVANVRERSSARQQFGLVRDTIGSVPLHAFQSRDGWASALLLVPDELTRVFGPAPSLILAPMRDLLLQLPIDVDRELADWLLDDFASIDPNGLDVPILALVDGELALVPGTPRSSRGAKGGRRH